jgi:hypothetical protein
VDDNGHDFMKLRVCTTTDMYLSLTILRDDRRGRLRWAYGLEFVEVGVFWSFDRKEFNKVRVPKLECLGRNLSLPLCSEPSGLWTVVVLSNMVWVKEV